MASSSSLTTGGSHQTLTLDEQVEVERIMAERLFTSAKLSMEGLVVSAAHSLVITEQNGYSIQQLFQIIQEQYMNRVKPGLDQRLQGYGRREELLAAFDEYCGTVVNNGIRTTYEAIVQKALHEAVLRAELLVDQQIDHLGTEYQAGRLGSSVENVLQAMHAVGERVLAEIVVNYRGWILPHGYTLTPNGHTLSPQDWATVRASDIGQRLAGLVEANVGMYTQNLVPSPPITTANVVPESVQTATTPSATGGRGKKRAGGDREVEESKETVTSPTASIPLPALSKDAQKQKAAEWALRVLGKVIAPSTLLSALSPPPSITPKAVTKPARASRGSAVKEPVEEEDEEPEVKVAKKTPAKVTASATKGKAENGKQTAQTTIAVEDIDDVMETEGDEVAEADGGEGPIRKKNRRTYKEALQHGRPSTAAPTPAPATSSSTTATTSTAIPKTETIVRGVKRERVDSEAAETSDVAEEVPSASTPPPRKIVSTKPTNGRKSLSKKEQEDLLAAAKEEARKQIEEHAAKAASQVAANVNKKGGNKGKGNNTDSV